MKKLLIIALLIIALAFSFSLIGIAQDMSQLPDLPMDPDVKTGKLDNGLTYYVRKNAYPEKRVNFYIAQKVGSIQEEESQRGLAHFLEHMCFNGTKNFPGNGVIRYCESLGVQFGSDLNAYTSIDQTVYRINNVPSTRQSALDSCLLIIHDWAGALLLEGEEIDKERGVIHEEWRLRTGAQSRMLERNFETVYPGSKYGKRFPIGLMSVVDNFKYDELRAYYKKWYHPGNQAVIVIGDIDVDYTINKIKEMFSDLKQPENPAPVVEEQVPDNAEPIVVVDKDKEQQYSIVEAMFKHDATPKAMRSKPTSMIESYAKYIVGHVLGARLDEVALDADCPFIQAGAGDGEYLYSNTKDAFTMSALPKEGRTEEAFAAVYREALRAAKFGITATEYQRAKSEYQAQIEKQYTNREKRESHSWGNDCRDHFLNNDALTSLETVYQFSQMAVPQLPVEMINMYLKELVSTTDSNLVVVNFNTEKEGAVYPTKESFLDAIHKVRTEELTAWVDNVKNEPLMTELPKAGKIKKESDYKYGYKKLELSNGATVYLKKTDFKADQVILEGFSKGGTFTLGEKDFVNAKMIDQVLNTCGLGNFDNQELQKALAGKIVSMGTSLDRKTDIVEGSSTPKDLETMLQLLYLHFTAMKKDQKAYDNMYKTYETVLKNQALNPQFVFSDSLSATLYGHNPRFTQIKAEDLPQLSLDRCLEIHNQHFSNAANFFFTITGNFDEETIRPLIEQYIAALPSKNKADAKWVDVDGVVDGTAINQFKQKMETPTANCYMFWVNKEAPVTLENIIKADAVGQVLDMVYLKVIREEKSAAYSASAFARASKSGNKQITQLIGVCPFKYEMEEEVLKSMREEAEKLGETVDSDMLTKVKEYMLKRLEDNQKKNGYWSDILSDDVVYGIDSDTEYRNIVNSLTPQNVAEYAKKYLLGGKTHIEVIMTPAE